MLRRRHGWDYRAPGWYMITICLADYVHERMGEILDSNRPSTAAAAIPQVGAIPPTGTIPHGDTILEATAIPQATAIPETPQVSIVLLPLGQLVDECLREIPANWPGVEIGPYVVMPDHIHCIIHITTRQKHPLGAIVGSFKAKSTARWRELGRKRPGSMDNKQYAAPLAHGAAPLAARSLSLWQPGYQDSILWGVERRERAAAYIADNPRRLAERRRNPDLFRMCRDLAIPLLLGERQITAHFAAVGNHQLLNHPTIFQVQCSRSFFAWRRDKWNKPLKSEPPAVETPEFRAKCAEAQEWAKSGAVIVDPCISEGEREIARRLFAGDTKMILLKNKGFSERGKPEGALFDRCAAGRLLVMAPSAWPYVPGEKKMTRFDACILNRIAQAIARDGAAEINYHGMRPADIDGIAATAVG